VRSRAGRCRRSLQMPLPGKYRVWRRPLWLK
jgi:hypothetical protein